MDLQLSPGKWPSGAHIRISGSKSETNRLLLLQAMCPRIIIENGSDSDDSIAMQRGLSQTKGVVDVGHAGTAMRFLAAYYAVNPDVDILLTGSARMKERPIGVLVDALRELGADIEYGGKEGFPPLHIRGRQIHQSQTSIRADISSQFLSALALVAPALENGLNMRLEGELTSAPYLEMTLALLRKVGVETHFDKRSIQILPAAIRPATIMVESDWSSASYFYSMVALAPEGTELVLSSFHADSRQGDRITAEIYRLFGVATYFYPDGSIRLIKEGEAQHHIDLDLSNTPDIAQTIAVTCRGLGISCNLYGLHTLKIKETDRLEALRTELTSTGTPVRISEGSLHLGSSGDLPADISVRTYHDHRMALAFAPLAIRSNVTIHDAGVVSKSYPSFWKDLEGLGIQQTVLD